ncbi:MAG: glycosyltransferase [Candidatus Solibacter sp.]
MPGRFAIGIVATESAGRVQATIDAVRRYTTLDHDIYLVGDGPDDDVAACLDQSGIAQSTTPDAQGMAACLNRLIRLSDAPAVVLLEAGSLVSPGWLEQLRKGLRAHPRNGIAGPSTNLCWNQQQLFHHDPGTGDGLEVRAHRARYWYANLIRTLEPLYSLADFCYVVRREVFNAIGPAEEAYQTGPCWEMDYNVRAARAGWRGVLAGSAYVERMPLTARRQRDEAALFETNKRLYQSNFCARQLSSAGTYFRSHCRGDACPNFAPRHIPLRAIRGSGPAVTCLMPTHDRRPWIARSIANFRTQTLTDSELLILDDGSNSIEDLVPHDPRIRYHRLRERLNIGAKRNLGCQLARGAIVVHWDDDDWYPAWRVEAQVRSLADADISGTSQLYYHAPHAGSIYRYANTSDAWVAGNTMAYHRSFWIEHPFPEIACGEDMRFLSDVPSRKVADLADPRLCIATIHPHNTSRKDTTGSCWRSASLADLATARREGQPLVSCIMPTFNRRAFLPLAIESFLAQDYPNLELIIVDDGPDTPGIIPDHPTIRYTRLSSRYSIGEKRNIACGLARGAIIAHWDDDDWYGPTRITHQVEPLLSGEADVTGCDAMCFLALDRGDFWRVTPDLHRRMFVGDVAGGTMVYWRQAFMQGIRYPDINLAEDAAFLRACLDGGLRLKRLSAEGAYVYMRHGANTWRFQAGHFLAADEWQRTQAPPALSPATVARYRQAAAQGGSR